MAREMPAAAPELPQGGQSTSGTAGDTPGNRQQEHKQGPKPPRAPHGHQGSRPAFPWETPQKHGVNHGNSREPQTPNPQSRDVGRFSGTAVTSAPVATLAPPGGQQVLGTHIWLPLAKICGKISHGEGQPAGHGSPRGWPPAGSTGRSWAGFVSLGTHQVWQLDIPPWEPRIFKHVRTNSVRLRSFSAFEATQTLHC